MQLKKSGVRFYESEHRYFYKGRELSGITGVLSRQLFPKKYDEVPQLVLERAAKKGTRIHSDCYTYDMFDSAESEEAKWYADLKKQAKFEVLDSEYLVTDFEHFASAIDKVLIIDNKVYLCDIKTTYTLDKDYISWQLSIYKYLFNIVNPDIEVSGLKAIWIREGATLHDIREIPEEEIIKLLECERNGEKYTYEVATRGEEEKAHNLLLQTAEIVQEIKRLKDLENEYNKQVEALFNSLDIEKWDNDYFTITRRKSYERKTFDTKKFASDYPDMVDKYMKTTIVKESITTKLKTT